MESLTPSNDIDSLIAAKFEQDGLGYRAVYDGVNPSTRSLSQARAVWKDSQVAEEGAHLLARRLDGTATRPQLQRLEDLSTGNFDKHDMEFVDLRTLALIGGITDEMAEKLWLLTLSRDNGMIGVEL